MWVYFCPDRDVNRHCLPVGGRGGVAGSEALLSVFCSGNITRHTLIVSVFSKLVKVCRNLSVAAAI